MQRIKRILNQHHRRDDHFIAQIKAAMSAENEENTDSYPWRCPCGRIKHKKGQWSVQFVMDPGLAEQGHRTQPKTHDVYEWQGRSWEDWEEDTSMSPSRSASRYCHGEPNPSPRKRTNQQRPLPKNESNSKGKDKPGKVTGEVATQGQYKGHGLAVSQRRAGICSLACAGLLQVCALGEK